MLVPRYRMSPDVGRYRPSSSRPKVVLPDPVSPTSASVSPRLIVNVTPSTARSSGRGRPGRAGPAWKTFIRSVVSRIGALSLATDTGVPLLRTWGKRQPSRVRAAVHLEHRPGDVRGGLGGEERDGAGNVRRMPGPAEGDGGDEPGPHLVGDAIGERFAPAAHVDVAGSDDVDSDTVRSELHREDLVHVLDRPF